MKDNVDGVLAAARAIADMPFASFDAGMERWKCRFCGAYYKDAACTHEIDCKGIALVLALTRLD